MIVVSPAAELHDVEAAARARVRSEDVLRAAVRAAVAAGALKRDVARAAGISRPTLDAWLQRTPGSHP